MMSNPWGGVDEWETALGYQAVVFEVPDGSTVVRGRLLAASEDAPGLVQAALRRPDRGPSPSKLARVVRASCSGVASNGGRATLFGIASDG